MNIIADVGDFGHMMGWDHMMDWWGVPFIGLWMILIWLVFVVIAFFVYRDAKTYRMNALLWFILVLLPWIGIIFLIVYLIIRGEKVEMTEALQSAQTVMDERYTKGEITREEYLQMKEDIQHKKREEN